MGRLNKQVFYLAGPIDRCTQESATSWRDEITVFLKEIGGKILNPLNKPVLSGLEDWNSRKRRKEAKLMGDYRYVANEMKKVRNIDLRLVDKADCLIVKLDMSEQPFGTIEEIVTANRSKKPILVYFPWAKYHAPDWLFGMIPHQMIFETLDEIKAYLLSIDKEEDDSDRWITINWELV